MLGLPRRTEVNKRINKTVIYEKFQLEPKQKEAFRIGADRQHPGGGLLRLLRSARDTDGRGGTDPDPQP